MKNWGWVPTPDGPSVPAPAKTGVITLKNRGDNSQKQGVITLKKEEISGEIKNKNTHGICRAVFFLQKAGGKSIFKKAIFAPEEKSG